VGKVDVRYLDPLGVEIGPAGVSAIVNECDGVRGLLVVFDGNNLDTDLYRKILERYRSRGYRVVEVATTDTHRATGIGLGRGYRIVGEHIEHSRILEAVDRAVAEAERMLGAHKVSYQRVEVEAEVLGEDGFQKIQRAVRMYKRVGGLVISAVFLVPILLILLFA
jgi:putative membrane protein